MKRSLKKLVSLVLVFAISFTVCVPGFAAENIKAANEEIINENITLDVNRMTPEEKTIYNKVIANAISKYGVDDANFNETVFVEQVNNLLYMMEYGAPTTRAIIEFSIPNNVVATAVNVTVSLAAGGATTAAIKTFVSKYGVKAAANMLSQKVTAKLLAIGIKELSGIGAVIRTIVKNILDPGSTVAEWLDNRDSIPGNGHVDVAVG